MMLVTGVPAELEPGAVSTLGILKNELWQVLSEAFDINAPLVSVSVRVPSTPPVFFATITPVRLLLV